MNRNFTYLLLVGAMGALASCANETDDFVNQNDASELKAVEAEEYLNITYKDKTYFGVPTTYDENGDFVFLDNEFSAIYAKELANDYDWSISAKDSQNITFYADLKSNLDANGIVIDNRIKAVEASFSDGVTRAGNNFIAEVVMYDDRDYKDRQCTATLNDTVIQTEVANLKNKPWRFNDKCSSIILTNNMPNDSSKTFHLTYFDLLCSDIDAVFIGYDDKNFSDRTITCVAPPTTVQKYASLPGFNDKMSSFKFFFAKHGQYSTTI